MKGTIAFPVVAGLMVMVVLLAGCYMPAAPDVTPTPSEQELIEEGMEQLGMEAAGYSATLTAIAESPLATPTVEPTAQPTSIPTAQPTVVPTSPPAPTPTPPPVQPTPVPTTATPSQETTYIVQPGDNLFRIALRFGMRYEELAAYNNIVNPHQIYVGQVIRIPGRGTGTPTPPVTGGETLYTVQPGDNLFRIALRYNLNYLYLAAYNGIANPHRIYVGQVIRIPATP